MFDSFNFGPAEIANVVAAFFALASAYFAYRTIRENRNQKEIDIYLRFEFRYKSEKMKAALRELAKLQPDEKFAAEWYRDLKAGDSYARALDYCRTEVKTYFIDVIRMYQLGYASYKLTDNLLNRAGINIFFRIVEPMERQLNPENWPRKEFDEIRKIRNFHGVGELLFKPQK